MWRLRLGKSSDSASHLMLGPCDGLASHPGGSSDTCMVGIL